MRTETMLLRCGCPSIYKRIVGWTTRLASGMRGQEIEEWMHRNMNPEKGFTYCIIDDDDDMLSYHMDSLVQTSPHAGLTRVDKDKVLEILNKDN